MPLHLAPLGLAALAGPASLAALVPSSEFEAGDVVRPRCDPAAASGMVVGCVVRPPLVLYLVAWSDRPLDSHAAAELARVTA